VTQRVVVTAALGGPGHRHDLLSQPGNAAAAVR
jgi:hypothetical protein